VRLIYYGTPSVAVPPLKRLVSDGRAPLLVVTRADRPRGRGLKSGKSAVREAAESCGLEVSTPARAGAPEAIARIRALAPDLLVVAAFGQIFPPALLAAATRGAINLHYSLLPRHRGASPIQAAILAGDRETGVSVMWMTEGLDEGPILLVRRMRIEAEDDAASLGSKLAHLAAECLVEALDRIERGEAPRVAQDPALATYAPKVPNDAGRLSLHAPAEELSRRVRAFTPEPGAFIDAPKGRLQILSASADAAVDGEPGTILAVERERGIRVASAPGSLWLRKVKPGGRREMSGYDYANGARLKPGDRVGAVSSSA